MPSNENTMIDLAYGLSIDRFFRVRTENGETILEGADGKDYPFLRWRGDLRLPYAKSSAIEFNGEWEHDGVRNRWNFVSHNKPYVFWVEQNGDLYARLWDEDDTTFLLANDVESCAAIRGWKNTNYWNHDHGIVVAYVKTDGKAYYRNYAKQPPNFPEVWEEERLIPIAEGNVTGINVFRTNDYRTGILIEAGESIYWALTERNWAGMAVPREYISVAPEVEIEFIKLEYPEVKIEEFISVAPDIEIGLGALNSKILEAYNIPNQDDDWGWIIYVHAKDDMVDLKLANVTVTDVDKGSPLLMASLTNIDSRTFTLLASDAVENGFNNVTGDINIKISGVANPAGGTISEFNLTFTPTNLEPEELPIPEFDSAWNE